MKLFRVILASLLLSLLLPANGGEEEDMRMVFVHYMPWYASKPVSGHWGWHWTMDHFDPDREVASHDPPLIGPYDSGDPHLLECHVLLMKYAGVDGVVIDWYGIKDFNDYAMIHRNTELLVQHLKRAGLKFLICYEDQAVAKMMKPGVLDADDDTAHGAEVMSWLDENWFSDPAYVRIDGRPVLLVFGPRHFRKEQWQQMTDGLSPRPLLCALPHLWREAGANGVFGWIPVSGGKETSPDNWQRYLRDLHALHTTASPVIAVAFPGYHDIYGEAGTGESYGYLDARDGRTFGETLDHAWQSGSPIIQVATWNDFGEGTAIEPTRALGYQYLEALQKQIETLSKPFNPYAPDDLRLPVQLYELRKRYPRNPEVLRELDRASALLFSSMCEKARVLMESIEKYTLKPSR